VPAYSRTPEDSDATGKSSRVFSLSGFFRYVATLEWDNLPSMMDGNLIFGRKF
jgi:hypothetical protein